ncbi:MAG TPA: sortase [Actinomycetota bacterium]|nr:sortase [Actinomycetota bacterium]
MPRPAAVAVAALLGIGVLAVWGWFYVQILGSVQERRAQHQLYATFQAELAAGTAPIQGPVAQGTPIAMLGIPTLGLKNLMVVEGTTSGDLEAGPGHRPDTPFPGIAGTSYLLGRSDTFGGPFSRIATLAKGSAIKVTTGYASFTFLVDAVRRPGDPLTAFTPGAARLTLVTSEATKGGARNVVYVDATLKGTPQQADSADTVPLPTAEIQMHGDPGAWLTVSLLLEGLVVVVVGLAWLRIRWGTKPTLLVGAPIVLAGLWALAAAGSQLLPNLF